MKLIKNESIFQVGDILFSKETHRKYGTIISIEDPCHHFPQCQKAWDIKQLEPCESPTLLFIDDRKCPWLAHDMSCGITRSDDEYEFAIFCTKRLPPFYIKRKVKRNESDSK